MTKWLARKLPIFRPPTYPDQEKTEVARSIYNLLLLLVVAVLVFSIVVLTIYRSIAIRYLYLDISVVVISGAGLWMNSKKQTISSVLLVLSFLWVLVTLLSINTGGLASPAMRGYLFIVLAAGLLIGGEAALITAIICWLTELSFVYLGVHQLLPASDTSYTSMKLWILHGGIYSLVIIFPYLTTHRIRRSLRKANSEIDNRKKAEENSKLALEWQEAIFEGSRDAVFISDSKSHFVMVNNAARELTGYKGKNSLRWAYRIFTRTSI